MSNADRYREFIVLKGHYQTWFSVNGVEHLKRIAPHGDIQECMEMFIRDTDPDNNNFGSIEVTYRSVMNEDGDIVINGEVIKVGENDE